MWYSVFRSNLIMLVYYAFHYRALHTMYNMYILYTLDYRSPACMTVVICISTLFSPMTKLSITLHTISQCSCTPCWGAQRRCARARTAHQGTMGTAWRHTQQQVVASRTRRARG